MAALFLMVPLMYRFNFLSVSGFERNIGNSFGTKLGTLLLYEAALYCFGLEVSYSALENFIHGGPIIICTIVNICIIKKLKPEEKLLRSGCIGFVIKLCMVFFMIFLAKLLLSHIFSLIEFLYNNRTEIIKAARESLWFSSPE